MSGPMLARPSSGRPKPKQLLSESTSRKATSLTELQFDQESSCLLLIVAVGSRLESTINSLSERLECLGVAVCLLVTDDRSVVGTLSKYVNVAHKVDPFSIEKSVKWTSKLVQLRVLVLIGDVKQETTVVEESVGFVCETLETCLHQRC